MEQHVEYDEQTNSNALVTKNDDGSVSSEPITAEQAAEFVANSKV